MKVENNGIAPLSSKPAEAPRRPEKKDTTQAVTAIGSGHDKVEMSDQARLLAKARAALENGDDADAVRLEALRKQIESGDYTVQVQELARKLLAKFHPK